MGEIFECSCDNEALTKAMDFVRDVLSKRKVKQKHAVRPLLAAEEIVAKMVESASEGAVLKVKAGGMLGDVALSFECRGEAFEISDIEKKLLFEMNSDEDETANDIIRGLIEKIFREDFSVHNEHGINKARLSVKKSAYAGIVYTLLLTVLGILTGYILQMNVSPEVSKLLSDNVLSPIYTVFMNAMKMVVAPLVFFSVASSIADFGDLKALGRIALKIVVLYLFTSMCAIFIGLLSSHIFPIGSPDLASAVTNEAAGTLEKSKEVEISIRDVLVNAVPKDIISPFQNSDMLQIIFLAVVLGLAAAAIASKMPELKKAVNVLNATFSKITAVLVKFIPLVVFCSMAKMMLSLSLGNLRQVLVWLPGVYLGDIMMICFYLILLLVLARLNPIKFLSKFYPAMASAFSLSSSNAALPTSINQCEAMGVSNKIYSFSLPLGATINMDGSCVTLMITSIFMARIFGIDLTGGVLFSLFISIMVLSVGSPGVPGGNLVCIALLIQQIGIPAEALSLVMGLYPIVSMMQTCVNVTGDAVVTTIVAKMEGKLDIKKYYS